MKVVVIGGSGLIGTKVVARLGASGHTALAASPRSGIDTISGDGLAEALDGASVVVDVSNAPSFEAAEVLAFFETSTRNLLAAEVVAGVAHHVALSVVGTDRLTESGYFRAKLAQERLIEGGPVPYSIVRATQFFEFLASIADAGADGGVVRLAPALIQPMASDDVARILGDIAVGGARGGTVDAAGPEAYRLDELIRRRLGDANDPRQVVTDPSARYFGARLGTRTLVPDDEAILGEIRLEDWPG